MRVSSVLSLVVAFLTTASFAAEKKSPNFVAKLLHVDANEGIACGDLDGDGDQDLAVTHADEPMVVLQNDGQPGRWLRLRLVGKKSHRDAVGASVTLQTSSRQLVRLVKGGGSYLSASEKAVCFLLPTAEVPETITIRWPAGAVETISVPAEGGAFTVVEGSDTLQPPRARQENPATGS